MAEPRQPSVEEILRDRNILTQKTKKAVQEYTTQKDKTTKENLTEIISDLFLEYGFNEFIKETLDKVPDLDLSNALNTSSIKRAAQDYELLKKITDRHHVNINAKYPGGKTLLHQPLSDLAYENLIKCGADPNIADNEGNKPLTKLIESNQREKLKIYHEHNREKLFEVDESGKRPIDKILQFLNPKNDPWQNTQIMDELGFTKDEQNKVGLEGGKYQQTLMEEIISKQSTKNIQQRTATWRLERAINNNNFEKALEIIKKDTFSVKEPIFKQKKNRFIFKLLRSKDPDATKVLDTLIEKELSLDVNLQGNKNYLHYFAKESPPDRFMNLLKTQTKLLKKQDINGDSPLHLFAQRKDIELDEYLLEIHNTNPILLLQSNKKGQKPITLFLANKNPNNDPKQNQELLKPFNLDQKTQETILNQNGTCKSSQLKLLDKIKSPSLIKKVIKDKTSNGLTKEEIKDIDKSDRNGKTALIHAAIGGYCASANILIKNEAKLDLADKEGKTALHHAIENNRINLAKQLIDRGAKLDLADKEGKTALNLAVQIGNKDLIDLILTNMDREYSKNPETIKKSILDCDLETLGLIRERLTFDDNNNPLDIILSETYSDKRPEKNYEKIRSLVQEGLEPSNEKSLNKLYYIAKACNIKGVTWEEIKPQIKIKQTNKATAEASDQKWVKTISSKSIPSERSTAPVRG